jgi:hypothetical protein
MNRLEILESIYHKNEHLYPEVRRFASLDMIKNRIRNIQTTIKGIAQEKRNSRNRFFRKLFIERKLLTYKFLIYTNSERLPPDLDTPRDLLQATDQVFHSAKKETVEQRTTNKMKHIVILLHLMFLTYSDEKLSGMLLERCQ